MKIKWKRAVSIILVMTLMVTFAQWKVYADEEKETTEIVENNLEVVYQEKEYKIIISLKEHWDSGYNANVKIENIGEETIENWYLQWVYEEDITNIWNAEVKSHQDANYIIKNVTWNQDIESGKSIEFGFSGNKSFTCFPKECKLVGDSSEVKKMIIQFNISWIVIGEMALQESFNYKQYRADTRRLGIGNGFCASNYKYLGWKNQIT